MQYLLSANVTSDPTIRFNDLKVHLKSIPLFRPSADGWHYLTVQIHDAEDGDHKSFYNLISKVFESWTEKDKKALVCDGVLTLANASEWTWRLDELYFVSIDFGELDFSSSESITIELTLKCRRCDLESIKVTIDPWLPKEKETCKTLLPYDSSVSLAREEKRGIMIMSGSRGHQLILDDSVPEPVGPPPWR